MNNDDDEQINVGHIISAPDQSQIIHEGYLKKKSPKALVFSWQERYVRLTKDVLFYYKDKKKKEYAGAIPLNVIDTIFVDVDRIKNKEYRFNIRLLQQYQARLFTFSAKNEEDLLVWEQRLKAAQSSCTPLDQHASGPAQPIWKPPPRTNKPTAETIEKQVVDGKNKKSLDSFLNLTRPLYNPLQPLEKLDPLSSPQSFVEALMGDYKVQASEPETSGCLGDVYILGGLHYPVTHESYLIHRIDTTSPYYNSAITNMEWHRTAELPLLPQQLHLGETCDSAYAIYHPPLRRTKDSLYCWLGVVQRFPEHILRHILLYVILSVQYIHSQGIPFLTLSPESLFFDQEGNLHLCDPFLGPAYKHNIPVPEYTSPEAVKGGVTSESPLQQLFPGDFWRLGILLYELATGFPPFRSDAEDYNQQQIFINISEYKGNLLYPPFFSNELSHLISLLLDPDPLRRLTHFSTLQQHPWFASIPHEAWDINTLANQPLLPWIYDNIVLPLRSPIYQTPTNLTFDSPSSVLTRLTIQIMAARNLPVELTSRLQCSVTVAGQSSRTKQFMDIPRLPHSPYGAFNIDESIDMYWVNDQKQLHDTTLVIVELGRVDPKAPLGRPLHQNTTGYHGIISLPLIDTRRLYNTPVWLTLYDSNAEIMGELQISFIWQTELIPLTHDVLTHLTSSNDTFGQAFVKPMPAQHDAKLFTLITNSEAVEDVKESLSLLLSSHSNNNNNINNINYQQQHNNGMYGGNSSLLHTGSIVGSPSMLGSPSHQPLHSSSLLSPSSLSLNPSGNLGGGSGSNNAPGGGGGGSGSMTPAMYAARGSPTLSPALSPALHSLGNTVHSASFRRTSDSMGGQHILPSTHSSGGGGSTGSGGTPSSVRPGTSGYSPVDITQLHNTSNGSGTPRAYAGSHSRQDSQQLLDSQQLPGTPPIPPLPEDLPDIPALPMDDGILPEVPGLPPEIPDLPPEIPDLPPEIPELPPEPAPVPLDPEVLPQNWKRAKDKDSGDIYYYNKVTKSVTWDPPPCLVESHLQ